MKVGERWFSWATAIAAVLAVLVLMAQALLDHQGRERAAAADIRRDVMDLVQAAAILERRLESGLRHYEAVVCGRTEVEVTLTDRTSGKRALRGEFRMRADLAALGAATSHAFVDGAVDGVAFASRRLTGELSLLHAASEQLEQRARKVFRVDRAGSGRSPPEQSDGQPEGDEASQQNQRSGSAPGPDERNAAGSVEHGCEPPLDRSRAGGGEVKAIIDFLQAAARDLAAYPYCELVALAEADAAGRGDGWTALGRLVDRIDKDRAEAPEGESGERGKLKDLFDSIGSPEDR